MPGESHGKTTELEPGEPKKSPGRPSHGASPASTRPLSMSFGGCAPKAPRIAKSPRRFRRPVIHRQEAAPTGSPAAGPKSPSCGPPGETGSRDRPIWTRSTTPAETGRNLGSSARRFMKSHREFDQTLDLPERSPVSAPPNPMPFQTTDFSGRIPMASRSYSSEKSYSPSMLMRAHDIGERAAIMPSRFSFVSASGDFSSLRVR